MFTDRETARVVGVLFIIASVAAVVGGSLALPLEERRHRHQRRR